MPWSVLLCSLQTSTAGHVKSTKCSEDVCNTQEGRIPTAEATDPERLNIHFDISAEEWISPALMYNDTKVENIFFAAETTIHVHMHFI